MMSVVAMVCLLAAAEGSPPGGPVEQTAAALGAAATKRLPSPDERAIKLTAQEDVDTEAAQRLLGMETTDALAIEKKRTELLQAVREIELAASSDGGPPVERGSLDPTLALALLETLEKNVATNAVERGIALLVAEQAAERARAELDAVRANQAEADALAAAAVAVTSYEQELNHKIATAESAREAVAIAHAGLIERAQGDLEKGEGDRTRATRWAAEAADPKASGGDLAALLPQVLDEQHHALDAVMQAIHRRAEAALIDAPVGSEGLTSDQVEFSSTLTNRSEKANKLLAQLRQSLGALETAQQNLAREQKERWLDVASAHFDVAERLHHVRLAIIGRLEPATRRALVGFTAAGIANMQVVAQFVWVDLRLHHQRRVHDVAHLPQTLSDPLVIGPLAWNLSTALVILLLVAWVWRRAPSIREFFLDAAKRRIVSPTGLRVTETIFHLLDALVAPAVIIGLAMWLDGHLVPVMPNPERTVVIEIAYWWAAYFAAARLTHLVIVRFARGRFSMTARKKLKVLRSVRFTLRYAVVAIYVLRLLRGLLGAGPAMGLVNIGAIVGLAFILLVVVRRWSEEIHAFSELSPQTSVLRRALEATKGRWFALALEALAAVVLSISALFSVVRSFLMGFDQVRRAGAMIFRLRVEQEAQRKGKTKFDIEKVPESVRTSFDEENVDDNMVIDHVAELDAAVSQVCTEGDERLSIIVHGPYGVGRATWLRRLSSKLRDRGQRVVVYQPKSRILGAGKLAGQIGRCLDEHPAVEPPDDSSIGAVVDVLNGCDEPLVLIVDGLEWLFLRTVNGYRALDALLDIMHRTHRKVSFVLSAPTGSFLHLDRSRSLATEVSAVVKIPRFTEAQIRELILRRQRRSGVDVSFKDLLVQNMDGMSEAAQVVENEEGYMRLLWTFSEGIPRVAMHFWLRSLVPDPDKEGALAVQLYDAPSADDLEAIPERDRFLLQSVVLHRALTVDQVAATCDVKRSQAQAHIHRGLELGLYTEFDSTPAALRRGGRVTNAYCVDVHFWEAAVRFLRRKKLY